MKHAALVLTLLSASVGFAEDAGKTDEPALTIDICHVEDGDKPCEAYAKDNVCGAEKHWHWEIEGKDVAPEEKVRARIRNHSDLGKAVLADRISEGSVVFRVDPNSPWWLAQITMNWCAEAGIYRIEWCRVPFRERKAAAAEGRALPALTMVKVWLPKDSGIDPDAPPIYFPPDDEGDGKKEEPKDEPSDAWIDVRVFIKYDAASDAVSRKVAGREVLADDDLLIETLKAVVEKAKKGGRKNPAVIVDAAPETPFKAVAHLTDLCRGHKFDKVEFAAPMPGARK
ncbi:MAG: hypothetical protein AAB074_15170 [Planctomycetota bacterium]